MNMREIVAAAHRLARRRATRLKLASLAAIAMSIRPFEVSEILREKRGDLGEVLARGAIAFVDAVNAELLREPVSVRAQRTLRRRADESLLCAWWRRS